jgi:hypothetical protein
MRSSFSAVVAALALAAVQCVNPRPSAEPLGWGPLPPGAQTASRPTKGRVPRVAQAREHPSDESISPADAGRSEPEKAAAAPSSSAPKAPSESKPTASPSSAATAPDFVGDYLGEDVATYRISGLPERTERDPKARVTVKSASDSELLFVLVDSSNGKEICALSGTWKDAAVTMRSGQKCFEQNEGEASAGATVKKGSATLEKKRLVLELDLDFEMKVEGKKLSGTLGYRFDGKRQ